MSVSKCDHCVGIQTHVNVALDDFFQLQSFDGARLIVVVETYEGTFELEHEDTVPVLQKICGHLKVL